MPSGKAKAAVHPTTAGKTAAANRTKSSSSSSGNCKTQITRAEFDKLMKAVAPTAPASARRQVASRYVLVLTEANEAVKLGVDKDSEFTEQFTEQVALMRLQLLAQNAGRKLQTRASNVSDADAKAYYDQNPSAFEEVTLTRIFVPRGATPAASGQQQPAVDSEAIAKSAREQLTAGGDPDKIEKSVYEQLKTTSEPPPTNFGSKRRGALPPAHEQKVFAASAGQLTDVIPDSVGYVIYRVDSKQQLPFEQVKDEIRRRITQQRMQDIQQQLTSSSKADYNDAYFGPETPAAAPTSGIGSGAPRGLPPSAGATTRSPASASAAPNAVQPQQSQSTTPKQ
jgi:parvulin-like peptidyl-prolyl isomerase